MNVDDLVDLDALGSVLTSLTKDERWFSIHAKLISGGKSNLTIELLSDAGAVILRRPPLGNLLPSAHDMAREARVQSALSHTSVPVARILFVDGGSEILGVPFYIMEKVPGYVIRSELPDRYAGSPEDKLALSDTLIDILLKLHSVDPTSIGLGDFGRADGYLERQINRWSGQWEKSKSSDVVEIDELATQLRSHLPRNSRSALVHGDYRLDNCVMSTEDTSQMNAVLDWELSSLGDPLVDLALTMFYWREPGDRQLTLIPSATSLGGFPSRNHLAGRYFESSAFAVDDMSFYESFARFKFAIITQGVLARETANAMAGQNFGIVTSEIKEIAEEGLEIITRKRRAVR
jgi:aminoglycoside phosphotransferase (APT) family kinase protein